MFRIINKRKQAEQARTQIIRNKAMQLSLLYQDRALNSTMPGVEHHGAHSIVVSLTSFEKRIDDVHLCIESLFQQSLKADRIILWLSRRNFPTEELPQMLRKQQERGLEIIFHDEDLGSYKKIHYALEYCPDSLILTVDDDTLYPVDMIDRLYRAYLANPDFIHCHKAHKITLDNDGNLRPYKQWDRSTDDTAASRFSFPVGVGGILYFPGCFDDAVRDKDAFLRLAPRADDIWLKAMSLKKGVLCKKVEDERHWDSRFLTIEGSQAYALKRRNKAKQDGNNATFRSVFDEYDLWKELRGR